MQVNLKKEGMILLIELKGRLDTSAPKDFEAQLLHLVESGERHLVFDFSQVEHVSSNGLRTLLHAFKRLTDSNGRMVFHSLNERVKRIFDIGGFLMIFHVYETHEEAVASVLQTGMAPANILASINHESNKTA